MSDWADTYGPNATGEYAGKSYWLATENWPDQNYPTNRGFYPKRCRYNNGYVPLYGVIGKDNEVFYVGNARAWAVYNLEAAIDSFQAK